MMYVGILKEMNTRTTTDIAQEHELHQLIVDSLDRLPSEMRGGTEDEALAWAHELRIHDSGRRNDADGYADILTLDEQGRTWIIEVKLATSAELNADVWKQLIRYRNGLKAMPWSAIHNYIDRFLDGQGVVKPYSTRFNNQSNLSQIIATWQSIIHRTTLSPDEIVNRIATDLRNGSAGLAVIADGHASSVIDGAKALSHDGPVAYLTALPTDDGLEYMLRFFREGPSMIPTVEHIECPEFDRYAARRTAKLTTASFAESLNPHVRPLWDNVVEPSLLKLGWDGTPYKAQRKGITISLPCRGAEAPLVRFAYSDTDSSDVPREYKVPGTYGLRVDLPAWHLTRCRTITRPDLEALACRIYALGWRGTGVGQDAGLRSLNATEYEKWGYMRYYPSPTQKDFLGRSGEEEALRALFRELEDFCNGE